ncbi:MAG: carotenoid 1,2-hydratase [Pseudomonadota bacterium]
MIGSVFSPYYAWADRRDPTDHIALNVGLYGKGVKRWTMTERGARHLHQTQTNLKIGPSDLAWDGEKLTITIREWAVPVLRRVIGKLILTPTGISPKTWQLDNKSRHFWHPIAPRCHVQCTMEKPALNWQGTGYIDSNWGSEALEDGFTHWDWSRADLPTGAGLLYDAHLRDGTRRELALHYQIDGSHQRLPVPPQRTLKTCPIWRMARTTRTKAANPKAMATLEDTPFYSRSHVQTAFNGHACTAVHESLNLRKFSNPAVRFLLPFRMPRRP